MIVLKNFIMLYHNIPMRHVRQGGQDSDIELVSVCEKGELYTNTFKKCE